jgi:hypothetical protein
VGTLDRIGPTAPHEKEDTSRDWKKAIPPWALLGLLMCALTVAGWLWGRVDKLQDRQLATLEAATRDAEARYVSGLSDRIAVVETDVRVLKDSWKQFQDSNAETTRALKALTVQNARLATEVEFMMTAQRRLQR